MKLSQDKSRMVGLRLVEAHLNFIDPAKPPLIANFALIREDGADLVVPHGKKSWSEPVQKALDAFVEALESECLPEFFQAPASTEVPDQEPTLGDEEAKQY